MLDIVKILIVLAVMSVLVMRKSDLGIAITASAMLLGLFFHMSLRGFLKGIPAALLSRETLLLAAALVLVLVFNDLWKETGQLRKVTDTIEHRLKDARVSVVMMPAMIGLMPISGGAYLSAPLVDASSRTLGISPGHKAFLNYWFRHIWEYFLPTYPGVLLAASIYGCGITGVIRHNVLLSCAAILGGILSGLWFLPKPRHEPRSDAPRGAGEFLLALLPLLVLLGMVLAFKMDMSAALAITIVLTVLISRTPLKKFWKIFAKNFSWSMVGIVLAVMYFKYVIEASGTLGLLSADFQDLGIPFAGVAVLLPFLIGILTGVTAAYVGITFPLLVSMNPSLAYLPLAYAAGYAGVMLSPTHLCFVMTCDYFKSGMRGVYLRMLVPLACVLATSAVLCFWFK